jgi:hypothetical protein
VKSHVFCDLSSPLLFFLTLSHDQSTDIEFSHSLSVIFACQTNWAYFGSISKSENGTLILLRQAAVPLHARFFFVHLLDKCRALRVKNQALAHRLTGEFDPTKMTECITVLVAERLSRHDTRLPGDRGRERGQVAWR